MGVWLLEGKTQVVAYYTEEQGLISIVKKYYVDIGDKTQGPYDKEVSLVFSPDGKALAYCAEIDCKWYVIAGIKIVRTYGNYAYIDTFSSDRKTLAYDVRTDNGYIHKLLLIDGTSYIDNICGGRAVYFKDGAIWMK